MERENSSDKFPIGSKLPTFNLPNVDGKQIGDSYLREGKFSLVVFTCNHCPYVKGSEAMLVELIKQYQSKGLKVAGISSNDARQYPDDSFEKMKEKAAHMNLPFPYLYDESQEVAKLFDAACTPECYLFDGSHLLVYHGGVNDNPKNASSVTKGYLARALAQVSEGKKPDPAFTHPLGCSIKWK